MFLPFGIVSIELESTEEFRPAAFGKFGVRQDNDIPPLLQLEAVRNRLQLDIRGASPLYSLGGGHQELPCLSRI